MKKLSIVFIVLCNLNFVNAQDTSKTVFDVSKLKIMADAHLSISTLKESEAGISYRLAAYGLYPISKNGLLNVVGGLSYSVKSAQYEDWLGYYHVKGSYFSTVIGLHVQPGRSFALYGHARPSILLSQNNPKLLRAFNIDGAVGVMIIPPIHDDRFIFSLELTRNFIKEKDNLGNWSQVNIGATYQLF